MPPRHHLVDEATALGLAHVDPSARDDQLHGRCESNDEREPRGEAIASDDVPAALERAELRVLGSDADIREERRLQSGRELIRVIAAMTGLKSSAGYGELLGNQARSHSHPSGLGGSPGCIENRPGDPNVVDNRRWT